MAINWAAAVLLIAASTTAMAQEQYKISYLETTPLENGTVKVKFVERQADLEEVLAELESSDKNRRFEMVRTLEYPATWVEPDRKTLVRAMGERLADDQPSVRYRAAHALLFVGPDAEAVLPALLKAAKAEEGLIKAYAIGAIGNIGPPAKSAIPVLTELLDSDHDYIPMHAIDALGRIGQEAVPVLIKALKSEKGETRFQVIEALELMGREAKDAIPALKQMSTDDEFLQTRAHFAIERIRRPSDCRQRRFSVYGRMQEEQEPEKLKE